jgi:hypothetical protein
MPRKPIRAVRTAAVASMLLPAALAGMKLEAVPVFDGMIAAGGRLFLATTDGRVLCLRGQ